jgi:uncharacterized protein YneF (UPF0154 family)
MEQLKIVLAMIGLVAIGFTGGIFFHRMITTKKIAEARHITREEGFVHHLMQQIEADNTQQQQIEPILRKYGRQIHRIHVEGIEKRIALVDTMLLEIQPLLTLEQQQLIQKRVQRFRNRPMRKILRERQPLRENRKSVKDSLTRERMLD